MNYAFSASSPEVLAALSDGEVSRDEYDAGYRRFLACMDAGGIPIIDMGMTEEQHNYGTPDVAVQSGLYDDCYNSEFGALDADWQLAHPTTSARLSECLFLAHDDFSGTVDEMKARLIEIGEDPEKCLAKK